MKTIILSLSLAISSLAYAAPAAPKAPAAPAAADSSDGLVEVATCVDGKTYYNRSGEHRGACSGHKGVASWADGSPVKSGGGASSYR
jgi:hypothetical protein